MSQKSESPLPPSCVTSFMNVPLSKPTRTPQPTQGYAISIITGESANEKTSQGTEKY